MFVDYQHGPDVFLHFLDGRLLVFLNVLIIFSTTSELKTETLSTFKPVQASDFSYLDIFTLLLVTLHGLSKFILMFLDVFIIFQFRLENLATSASFSFTLEPLCPPDVLSPLDVL